MEVMFQKNAVKKGDPGFQYDKRIDFKYTAEEVADNSWDESDDSGEEGVEVVAASRVYSKPKGVGIVGSNQKQIDNDFEGIDENDNDYFDDDFV